MQDFLASPLFKILVALVALGALVNVARKLFFRPKLDAQHVRVRCPICGWTGTVGKYMRKCSRCASTTLEPVK